MIRATHVNHGGKTNGYTVPNPQAQAEIRAPLFEDKVVDFIAELATVNERKVEKEILFADPEDEPTKA